MVFISAIMLRVRSLIYLIPFFRANDISLKQLYKIFGFWGGKEVIDTHLTFWTLTMWITDLNMKEFRNSMAHRKAMQKLPVWCNQDSYFHYTQNEAKLKDWNITYKKMIIELKTSKVLNPSSNQLFMNYPQIKWIKTERVFKSSIAP